MPSTSAGIWRSSSPVAARSSLDHLRAPVSSQEVPAESDISDICSPVSQTRRKSFGSRTQRIFAKTSGSLFFTQASFGAVKPGKTMLPVILRKRGSASSVAASRWLRVSFHMMQGRSTLSSASSRVAPCM